MLELDIEISENALTIRENFRVLYTIVAGKIIVHTKNFPKLVDQEGRDWSKDIRESPESERPEYKFTFTTGKSNRTIDLYTLDDYVTVYEGQIIRFQMQADSCSMHCDFEAVYEDGWDPLAEAVEFTLHKKGRYQYIESHHPPHRGDLIRVDLDSGDHVNISELERVLKARKNPPPAKTKSSSQNANQSATAAGCCGCAAFLFILFLLLGLLGR